MVKLDCNISAKNKEMTIVETPEGIGPGVVPTAMASHGKPLRIEQRLEVRFSPEAASI